jgi:plastocyanin
MRLARLGIVLMICLAACRQTTAPPVDLVVTLEASKMTAARGDSVTFVVNAAGNNLFGVVIDYGDSVGDQYASSGALTARVTFKHAYTAAGTYTVRATVTDAIVGEKEATVSVIVN